MKGHAQKSLLVVNKRMAINNVQKLAGGRAVGSLSPDPNSARLLENEQASRMVRRFRHPDRTVESQGREGRLQADLGQRLGDHGKRGGHGEDHQTKKSDSFHSNVRRAKARGYSNGIIFCSARWSILPVPSLGMSRTNLTSRGTHRLLNPLALIAARISSSCNFCSLLTAINISPRSASGRARTAA